ncbi:hypothetical protein BDP55DRAFT_652984 [Colletotrichum godetiae]|uniref:Transmembrane protein n=1 Tax=Colletotrichum godetiae TaxID=1209918 RepID=A0AAJ0F1C5_9PEZI|nr:uncharacterized protein BDP55DRAFT_652984 [Colletotrichum godetiae]KAK1689367.1 hypothetical protein BDP55DRAFT_652984 [Colletotrichum godetiae]
MLTNGEGRAEKLRLLYFTIIACPTQFSVSNFSMDPQRTKFGDLMSGSSGEKYHKVQLRIQIPGNELLILFVASSILSSLLFLRRDFLVAYRSV